MNIVICFRDGGFISGEVGPFKFSAKVFVMPSEYGIDGGRISKLSIFGADGFPPVVRYDRGWDIMPKTEEAREALEALIQAFDRAEENK